MSISFGLNQALLLNMHLFSQEGLCENNFSRIMPGLLASIQAINPQAEAGLEILRQPSVYFKNK